MTLSNCLVFALALYWRRWLASRRVRIDGERYFIAWKGGPRRLLLRLSRLGSKLPHVLYAEQRNGYLHVIHYVPNDPKVKSLPPPLFRGHIKRGDFADTVAVPPWER